MRTAIKAHQLLPEGRHLETLSHRDRACEHPRVVRDGDLLLPVVRSRLLPDPQPLLAYSLGSSLARHLRRAQGPSEALFLRRALLREAHLLREATGRRYPRPQDEPVRRGAPGNRSGAGRARRIQASRGAWPGGRPRRPAPEGKKRSATERREGEGAGRGRLRFQESGQGGPERRAGERPMAPFAQPRARAREFPAPEAARPQRGGATGDRA